MAASSISTWWCGLAKRSDALHYCAIYLACNKRVGTVLYLTYDLQVRPK